VDDGEISRGSTCCAVPRRGRAPQRREVDVTVLEGREGAESFIWACSRERNGLGSGVVTIGG